MKKMVLHLYLNGDLLMTYIVTGKNSDSCYDKVFKMADKTFGKNEKYEILTSHDLKALAVMTGAVGE